MTILYNLIIGIITWVVIYLIEKGNIFSIWLKPFNKRCKEFFKGFFFMACLCLITQTILSQISSTTWTISKDFNFTRLFDSFYFDINSVIFEELFFRGAILYLLIKHLDERTGLILSATAFGIYHWYTSGVLGNLMAMLVVFIVTGFMGYVFAIAYAKTKSLILPYGLHLGWNLVNHNIFSNGPNGVMFLEVKEQPDISNSYQWISFGLYFCVTILTLFLVKSKYFGRGQSAIANKELS